MTNINVTYSTGTGTEHLALLRAKEGSEISGAPRHSPSPPPASAYDAGNMTPQHRIVSILLLLLLCSSMMVTNSKSYGSHSSMLSTVWEKAVMQSLYEQEIEDDNSIHRIDNHLVRRLIVMPLTDAFNPHQASGMHGKVQYGDKCSLPGSIGRLIFEKPYEVPWLFEIKKSSKQSGIKTPIPNEVSKNTHSNDENSNNDENSFLRYDKLSKAYISPLDFRSPENYIFLPKWLMKNLELKSNDVVDVSFIRIQLASLVTLQPLTLAWDDLIKGGDVNPVTILEREINKYSSLTCGSTITIQYKGIEYFFYVKETKAENGVAVKGVRVQDSDIKCDIDRSVLDKLLEAKKKRKEADAKGKKSAKVEKVST